MYVWRIAVCLLIAATIFSAGPDVALATWSDSTSGGYHTWFWDGSQKFRRSESGGVWEHYSSAGTAWYALGGAALPSTTFIGDGGWYNLGNGFTYSYLVASNLADFKKGGISYRFRYYYGPGRWVSAGSTGGWQLLGNAGVSASFVGDSAWHDLKNGFSYSYKIASELGYFKKGGTLWRFEYYYGPGRWLSAGNTGGWQLLGNAGLSSSFVGDGAGWHDLKNGFSYAYTAASDVGTFALTTGLISRFRYAYGPRQWYDYYSPRGWMALGNAGQSAAFIGDGAYRALGQGFDYKFSAGYGYFRYDTAHHFRQSYANGSWSYEGPGGAWSPWAATTVLGSGYTFDVGRYVVAGGYLYFVGDPSNPLCGNLYRFDGTSVTNVSNHTDLLNTQFLTAIGTDIYLGIYRGALCDVYKWNGTTFANVSNSNFFEVRLLTTSATNLYVAGKSSTSWGVYKYDGTSFGLIPNAGSFTDVGFLTALGTDLYFKGQTILGMGLYKYNGSLFSAVYNNPLCSAIDFLTISGTDAYFGVTVGTSPDVYKWNGASLANVSNLTPASIMSLSFGGKSGADLYFTATGPLNTVYLFKWNGASFADVYTAAVGTGAWYLRFLGDSGTDLFYTLAPDFLAPPAYYGWRLYKWNGTSMTTLFNTANPPSTPAWGVCLLHASGQDLYFYIADDGANGNIYRWNGSSLADISNTTGYSSWCFLGVSGSRLYFNGRATGGTSGAIYRYNGTSFDLVANGLVTLLNTTPLSTDYAWYSTDLFLSAAADYSAPMQIWRYWPLYATLSARGH